MGMIMLIGGTIVVIFACLCILLVPIMMEQMKDLAKDFWAARIAWREGKEKYMKYIESHK